jgi:hypothetical protein
MNVRLTPDVAGKAALVALVVLALAIATLGYGRGDIVRWFGAFLMCG